MTGTFASPFMTVAWKKEGVEPGRRRKGGTGPGVSFPTDVFVGDGLAFVFGWVRPGGGTFVHSPPPTPIIPAVAFKLSPKPRWGIDSTGNKYCDFRLLCTSKYF